MKSLFYRPIKINPPPFFFNQKLILFLSSSAIFLTIGILVFAFSLPTVNPPQNNKSKPIDTTNTPQSKQGPLGATLFRDTNNQNYYLNPSGRSKLGGPLNLNNNPIKNVKDPVNNQDVATKAYVDKKILTTTFLNVPTCSSQGFNPFGNSGDLFVCPKDCSYSPSNSYRCIKYGCQKVQETTQNKIASILLLTNNFEITRLILQKLTLFYGLYDKWYDAEILRQSCSVALSRDFFEPNKLLPDSCNNLWVGWQMNVSLSSNGSIFATTRNASSGAYFTINAVVCIK